MTLQNEQYTVTASVETTPQLSLYDIVHNTENIDTADHFMARTFDVLRSDGHSLRIALLDLVLPNDSPYAVLEGNLLTTILFDAILRLDMDTGRIIQYVPCKNLGGLFELHAVRDGYLIRGESELFRCDANLRQIWSFSGRDILVSLHAKKSFRFDNDRIYCRDFMGWQYILDMNGNLIEDFHEFIN